MSRAIITIGGHLDEGRVRGGETLAARPLELGQVVTIGRDPGCTIRIPHAGDELSRQAASIRRNDDGVWLRLTNLPGGTVCTADDNRWTFARERNRLKALERRALPLCHGDRLWLPPRRTPADALVGGYWIRFDLDETSEPVGGGGVDDDEKSGDTDVGPVELNGVRALDLDLTSDQWVLLTAVFAAYVCPEPGKAHQRAPDPGELIGMLQQVGATSSKLTRNALNGRLNTLINRVLNQTKTVLPHEPGHQKSQLLADWCNMYMEKSEFDHQTAKQLVAIRCDLNATDGRIGD